MLRKQIADDYKRAPLLGPQAARAWHELAIETAKLAAVVRPLFAVTYTEDSEPYVNAQAMLADIAAGNIRISTANSEHPLWTVEQNLDFRLVHDVLGHGLTGSDFSWAGEVAAYEEHLRLIESPFAKQALFTEAIGQVAYALEYGAFTAQKCFILPTWQQFADLNARAA